MGNRKKNMCKLAAMFSMNFVYFLVELVVGYICNSTALIADSFHMLSDVAALLVAFFAVRMSQKKWSRNTYGWARAEVLGALVNAVFLTALCFSIFVESIQRLFKHEELENPVLLLGVGAGGLLMNLVGLCLFRDHGHSHGHNHSHGGGHDEEVPLQKRRSTLRHSNRLTRMVSNVEPRDDDDDSPTPTVPTIPCDVEYGDCVEHYDKAQATSMTMTQVQLVQDKHGNQALVRVDVEGRNDETVPILVEPVQTRSKDVIFRTRSQIKNKGTGADQMNIHGVFLHLMADTLGSVIVVVSALVVWLTNWEYKKYVDPCLSICMVTLIMISVYPLLVESSLILLQSVPDHINMDELERKLLKQIDGVMGIHELHVWQLAGDRIIATAHIKCRNLHEYFTIAEKVKAVFHNEGIHSTTIQPEFSQQVPDISPKIIGQVDCYLSCSALSTETGCSGNTCCPPPNGHLPE